MSWISGESGVLVDGQGPRHECPPWPVSFMASPGRGTLLLPAGCWPGVEGLVLGHWVVK